MKSRKMIHRILFAKQKQKHKCREQTYGYQGAKGGSEMNWETGVDVYTVSILCIKQMTMRTYCIA